MGTKYTTQSATGYNSSPPPDDGTTVASNKITWAGIKTKLADSIKTLADAINSQIVNALDYSISTASTAYTTVAGDHEKMIGTTGTTTISLGDATTMAVGYRAGVSNDGTSVVTVAVITATDTLNGQANGTVKLLPGQAMWFVVNSTHVGYDIYADANRATVILSSPAGVTAMTAACDSTIKGLSANQLFLFIPANDSVGATTLNITPSGGSAFGAKNVFANGAAIGSGTLKQNVPVHLEYDGTQFNILSSGLSTTATQAAATVFSGPLTGSNAAPTFKAAGSVGSSMVLFGSKTLSVAASVTLGTITAGVSDIQWDWTAYDFVELYGFFQASGTGASLEMEISEDGGSTFKTSANYQYGYGGQAAGVFSGAAATNVHPSFLGGAFGGTGGNNFFIFKMTISKPSTTGVNKYWGFSVWCDDNSGNSASWQGNVAWLGDTNAISGAKFLWSGGQTISGVLYAYGLRKS